jgi:hypothetical protein
LCIAGWFWAVKCVEDFTEITDSACYHAVSFVYASKCPESAHSFSTARGGDESKVEGLLAGADGMLRIAWRR